MGIRAMVVSMLGFAAIGMFALSGCTSETEASAQIKLPTIQCTSCGSTVTKALEKVDGVKSVEVDLEKKQAKVSFLASKTDLGRLEGAVTKVGYAANNKEADSAAYANLPGCCKIGGH